MKLVSKFSCFCYGVFVCGIGAILVLVGSATFSFGFEHPTE